MALFRQAEIADEVFDIYAAQLAHGQHAIEDIELACHRHGMAERADGETAFPSMGQLLNLIDLERRRKINTSRLALAPPTVLIPPPLSRVRAAIWMERLKASGAGMSRDEVEQRFPFPDEDAQ